MFLYLLPDWSASLFCQLFLIHQSQWNIPPKNISATEINHFKSEVKKDWMANYSVFDLFYIYFKEASFEELKDNGD